MAVSILCVEIIEYGLYRTCTYCLIVGSLACSSIYPPLCPPAFHSQFKFKLLVTPSAYICVIYTGPRRTSNLILEKGDFSSRRGVTRVVQHNSNNTRSSVLDQGSARSEVISHPYSFLDTSMADSKGKAWPLAGADLTNSVRVPDTYFHPLII